MEIKPFIERQIDDLPRENIDLIIENTEIFPKEAIENKKLLTIATTGIQNIKFLTKNPKKINSIDNSVNQIILNYLLLSGIKNLSYEEFGKTFIDININFKDYFEKIKNKLLLDVPVEYHKKAEEIIINDYRLGHRQGLTDWQLKEQYNWFIEDNFKDLKKKIHKIKLYSGEFIDVLKNKLRGKYDFVFLSDMRDTMEARYKNQFNDYENLLVNNLLKNTSEGAFVYITEIKAKEGGDKIALPVNKDDKYSINKNQRWLSNFNLVGYEKEREIFEKHHYLLRKK